MSYQKEKLVPGYKGEFVIQHHFASNDHFDLRIEFPVDSLKDSLTSYIETRNKSSHEPQKQHSNKPGVVLRSWAIPKHKIPNEKPLLATETEDHDFAYRKFEGTIPEGNYGAGKVEIFDKGIFELIGTIYDKKYVFDFKGKKLNGLYALIKIKGKKFLWLKVKNTTKYRKSSIEEMIVKSYESQNMHADISPLRKRRDYGEGGHDFLERNMLELLDKNVELSDDIKEQFEHRVPEVFDKKESSTKMKKNIIATIAEEIFNDLTSNEEWNGPSGKCWCDELQKFISPQKDKCSVCKSCPECQPLFATDGKAFRYLRLHDDYKSYGS